MNVLQKLIQWECFWQFCKIHRFKNVKQNINTIQFLLFAMNPQFSLEVLNFSFLISCVYKMSTHEHIFFCIIGLCHIKIPLMKLKNFTQSFCRRLTLAAPLLFFVSIAKLVCNIVAAKQSFIWMNGYATMNAIDWQQNRVKWQRQAITNDAKLVSLAKSVHIAKGMKLAEHEHWHLHTSIPHQIPQLIVTHACHNTRREERYRCIHCFHSIHILVPTPMRTENTVFQAYNVFFCNIFAPFNLITT